MNAYDNDSPDYAKKDDELVNAQDSDENNDDFCIVNEEEEVEEKDETAAESLLKPDATVGLRVEAPEDAVETYALSSESNATYDAPTPTTTTDARKNEDADVYGIAPLPEPREAPKTRLDATATRPQDAAGAPKKSKKNKKSSKEDADESFDQENVSLDTLYERRQSAGETEYEKLERRPLPERPFWDEIFKPFKSAGFIARIMMTAGAAFIPLLCATFFFSNALSHNVKEMMANDEIGAFLAFYSCLWNDRLVFLLFCFAWGVFSAPLAFQIFIDTASGADEIDEWPEYNFVGGLGQFLWIVLLMVLAGIPGSLLFTFLGLNHLVGAAFSSVILTPVFFLSCMQADALFALITKDVFLSLKYNMKSWLYFVGIAFAFFFGTVGVSLAAIRSAVVTVEGEKISIVHAAIVAAILSLVFSFIPALYLRFLGRLGWIIEDGVRQRLKEAAEAAEEDVEEDAEPTENA